MPSQHILKHEAKMPISAILKYYWEASTRFNVQSPFVHDFVKNVMNAPMVSMLKSEIEAQRKELIHSSDTISMIDYGAGNNNGHRKVSQIARKSLSGKWQCRILHNIIKHYKCAHLIELGTSLGISTSYLASGNPGATLHTFEGNPETLDIAKKVTSNLSLSNISFNEGDFNKILDDKLESISKVDFAFLDGNHRCQATLNYFEKMKPFIHDSSILAFDDIYWSKGMQYAWEEIKNDSSVAFTIDLFRMGLVFFDKSVMGKRHFKLIDYYLKFWKIGVFG